MGWNDNLTTWGDGETMKKECKFCKKIYVSTETPQIPGFRDRDYDVCPYCFKSNRDSMEVEFSNRKVED